MKKFNFEEELWQQNLIDIKRISKDIPNNNSQLNETEYQKYLFGTFVKGVYTITIKKISLETVIKTLFAQPLNIQKIMCKYFEEHWKLWHKYLKGPQDNRDVVTYDIVNKEIVGKRIKNLVITLYVYDYYYND